MAQKKRSADSAVNGPSKTKRSDKKAASAKARRGGTRRKDDSKPSLKKSFPIVGIGASAGGLGAFTALLSALPADTGMAFVLVQHMDPTHKSMLTELLRKTTKMPVAEVSNGMKVQADHVYVIPSNTSMTIRKGTLRLVARRSAVPKHMPIDHFFRALAEDQQNNAIGVVLSGSATDGTEGLKAIKTHGGITLAQDPDSAKFSGMPVSAIASGSVDSVLSPEGIAKEQSRLVGDPYMAGAGDHVEAEAREGGNGGFRAILHALRNATGVDFRDYKPTTIHRRIARRMAMRGAADLSRYAQLIRSDPAEAGALYEDIFIHVTRFFRDSEAFETLQSEVIRKIVKAAQPDESIRIWVAGCSSGEEAYSIAILLLEELGDRADGRTIQIFGTDILESSIVKARAGIYPESAVADISPERLRRFFVRVEGGYQVIKPVRERCIFARQNLVKDPPFSKLDLVACRNVLIYLDAAAQRKVMAVFHYSLKPTGVLFLGKSESLTAHSDLFTFQGSKYKIYSRKSHSVQPRASFAAADHQFAAAAESAGATAQPPFDLQQEIDRIIIARYAPAAVVVDADLHILEARGDTTPYLSLPAGKVNLQLLRMARPELALELRTAIQRAKKQKTAVSTDAIAFNHEGRPKRVRLELVPIQAEQVRELNCLVIFEPVHQQAEPEPRRRTKGTKDGEIDRLNQELTSTREHLRSIIEDQEALNEEMKAANEEILSSNEELQSTNEELETAKEELQSSNEELTTLNEELQNRNTELDQLTTDLSTLLVGIEIPVIIVGRDLRIRRFTPSAAEIFNLISGDVGRPIGNIKSNLDAPNLEQWIAEVVDQGRSVEREVRDHAGHWYSLRMRPYRTSDDRMGGILIALSDIDLLKRNLEETTEALLQAEAIVETVRGPLLVVDSEFRVVVANRAFCQTFEVQQSETETRSLFELGGGLWNIPKLRTLLKQVLPRDQQVMDFEVDLDLPRVGRRRFLLNARQITVRGAVAQMILIAIEDISKVREALEKSEERFRLLAENTGDIVSLHDAKGRYLYVSPAIEQQLGHRPDELIGTLPWLLVHPDEQKRYRKVLRDVVKTGKEGVTTCRARKESGGYVWLESLIKPMLDERGRVFRLQSSSRDVSRRIEAEEALRDSESELKRLAAGLLRAQDEERQRVARELHDDFNQRLGMLARDAAQLEEQLPSLDNKSRKGIRAIHQRADKLAEDASRIAYQLHPSAVEHLGLAATLRSYCAEFSNRESIRTQFSQRTVPADVPKDIALCLYRVTQESLRNVAKHSGSKQARIVLTGVKNGIKLSVSDSGAGFSLSAVRGKAGLGLAGMEERARLVGGNLSVQSQPGAGTQIEIRVPLPEGDS